MHDTPESDLIEWRLCNYDMYSSQTHTVYILCIDSSCVSLLFIYNICIKYVLCHQCQSMFVCYLSTVITLRLSWHIKSCEQC